MTDINYTDTNSYFNKSNKYSRNFLPRINMYNSDTTSNENTYNSIKMIYASQKKFVFSKKYFKKDQDMYDQIQKIKNKLSYNNNVLYKSTIDIKNKKEDSNNSKETINKKNETIRFNELYKDMLSIEKRVDLVKRNICIMLNPKLNLDIINNNELMNDIFKENSIRLKERFCKL